MLLKKPIAGHKVEVTFRMPPMDDVVELYLCGDFNDWKVKGVPLSQDSDGTWFATVVLDAGKSYRFRYIDNQGRWTNDREADAHLPNDFGSEDSVVDLTHAGAPLKAAEKRPAAKKTAKKPVPKKPATKRPAAKKPAAAPKKKR
jgi:1,4-alpha-glucan branching enzyme